MEEVRRRRATRVTLRGRLLPMEKERVERPRGTRDVANVDPEPGHMREERREPNASPRQRRETENVQRTYAMPLSRTAQTLFESPSLSSSDPPPNLRASKNLVLSPAARRNAKKAGTHAISDMKS